MTQTKTFQEKLREIKVNNLVSLAGNQHMTLDESTIRQITELVEELQITDKELDTLEEKHTIALTSRTDGDIVIKSFDERVMDMFNFKKDVSQTQRAKLKGEVSAQNIYKP